MKRIYYYLYILVTLLATPAYGQPDDTTSVSANQALEINRDYQTIGEHAFYLQEETDKRLNLAQARKAFANNQFTAADSPVPGFGLTGKGVWLKFEVHNKTDETLRRRLSLEATWLDYIEIYIIKNDQLVFQNKTGDAMPLSSRQINNRLPTIEHDFTPGISEVYLRAQSHEPLILPLSFYDLSTATQSDSNRSYGYGILYGIISGLLLFNLLIYISIRQQRYLFYVLYLAMYLFMDVSYTGHGYFYFWQDAIQWQHWMPSISIMLYATSGILFALSFLKIKELFPAIYTNTIRFCIFICSLQILLIILDYGKTNVVISLLYVMFFSLFTFYYAIISFNKGHNDAIYYLAATIATLIGAATTVLSVLSVIPYTPLTFHAGEIAVAFDSILLSIALAEQIRRAQNEKLHAQQLARTDILTRLGNRLAFDEISEQIWKHAARNKQPLCFVMLDIDRFKKINDNHGHATGDTVLKTISATLQKIVREGDVLVRWGGEEFAIMLPQTSLPHAEKLAERIRKAVEALKISTETDLIKVTVSLGVAEKNSETNSITELFSLADHCLYQAKQDGRNRVCTTFINTSPADSAPA